MKLYRGNNTELAELAIDNNTTITNRMMVENTLRVSTVSDQPIDLLIGDYTVVDGERYEVYDTPQVNIDGNTYGYDVLFVGNLHRLDSWLLEESSADNFYYFDTFQAHVKFILDAVSRKESGWTYTIDSGDIDAAPKNIDYGSISCLGALHKLATEYGVEFDVKVKNINFARRIERVSPFEFAVGRGEGLYSIARGQVSNDKITTRLFALGGKTNMANDTRLTFDEKYVERDIDKYGLREDKVVFDNVFPRHKGSLTSDAVQLEEGKVLWRVVDSKMDFDLKTQFMEEPKIVFTTGGCAGLEFVITDYDHATKIITFKEYADTSKNPTYVVPNPNRKPLNGDEYHYINIIMPEVYITNAKAELKEAAHAEISRVSSPTAPYTIDVDPRFIKASGRRPVNGDMVRITNDEIGLDSLIRVIAYTYPVVNPNDMELTVCDNILISGSASMLRDVRKEIAMSQSKYHPLTGSKYIPMKAGRLTASEVEVLEKTFSEDFTPGLTGFALNKDEWGRWLLEVDRIIARESLTVPEFVKNRITVANNQTWFTDNGIIETLAEVNGQPRQRIITIAQDKGGACTFQLDDLLKGMYLDEVDGGLNFQTVRMTVLELITPYTLRVSVDENTPPPREELIVVRTGNRTNAERQNSIFMDGARPAMFYYVNVDSHLITERNIAQATGNLKGFNFGELTGNQPIKERFSSIMRGDNYIAGHLVQMSGNGLEYPLPAERGAWMADETYYHYDRVSHSGSMWDCVVDRTTAEPSTATSYWTERVKKGEGVNSLKISGVNLMPMPYADFGTYYEAFINVDPGKTYIASGNCTYYKARWWPNGVSTWISGNPFIIPSGCTSVVVYFNRDVPLKNARLQVEQANIPSVWTPSVQDEGRRGINLASRPYGDFGTYYESAITAKAGEIYVASGNCTFYKWRSFPSDTWHDGNVVVCPNIDNIIVAYFNRDTTLANARLQIELGVTSSEWRPSKSEMEIPKLYQGDYTDGRAYDFNNIVKYGATYYTYVGKQGDVQRLWNPNNWESFGASFESVATNLLLAENAVFDLGTTNEIRIRKTDGTITAGMTGKGTAAESVRIWAGGPTPAAANHVVRENGSARFGELDVAANGGVTIREGATPIVLFSKTNINTLSEMLAANIHRNTGVMPDVYENIMDVSDVTYSMPTPLVVSPGGGQLSIRGKLTGSCYTIDYGAGVRLEAWVTLLRDGGYYHRLAELTVSAGPPYNHNPSQSSECDFSANLSGVPAGTYSIQVRRMRVGTGGRAPAFHGVSEARMVYNFTPRDNQTQLGRGVAYIHNLRNHVYFGSPDRNANFAVIKSDTSDLPGVLASCTVNQQRGISNEFGAKVSTTPADKSGGGKYVVKHNIGHTKYTVQVTPNTTRGDMTPIPIVYSKGTHSAEIHFRQLSGDFQDTGFDITFIGNNQLPPV